MTGHIFFEREPNIKTFVVVVFFFCFCFVFFLAIDFDVKQRPN